MSDSKQTYANHSRYHPPFHFFLLPVVLIYIIYNLVNLIRAPGLDAAVTFVISIVLFVLGAIARGYALKVQDRLIRVEMRQRLVGVLPDELQRRINELTISQCIALRFAPDAELPELVNRVLNEGLTKSADIKKQIKDWMPDPDRI